MKQWHLPRSAEIGGKTYGINADYRDILEIMGYLEDTSETEEVRWQIAIALFYDGQIPREHWQEAMEYLAAFINCGEQDDTPGPKLLDWEQDAQPIIADVNKVAGKEIRDLPFLHWWTFISYFHAIGEGQLSTLVSIRDKLRRRKPLEKWEQEYYNRNRAKVHLKPKYSSAEEAFLKQWGGG